MTKTEALRFSWPPLSSIIAAFGFFLLVLFAGLSYPVIEYGRDAVTVFDLYLILYVIVRSSTVGFTFGSFAWRQLVGIWAVYLAYLLVSAAFVAQPFSALLWLKHVEHLVFLLCLVDFFESSDKKDNAVLICLVALILVVLYQLAYYRGMVPGFGYRYRIGLPFMDGISPNPAGFFLSSLIVFIITAGFWSLKLLIPSLIVLPLAGVALARTISRTNILGLMLVVAAAMFYLVWRSKWRWPLTIAFAASLLLFFFFVVPELPQTGPLSRIVFLLQDPSELLEDRSLATRFETLWPMGIAGWTSSPTAIFVGRGLGHFDVVDGTVPRLLGEQGLVGLLLFAFVWYGHYLLYERRPSVMLLLLLAAINSITAETLIVSYRSIQLYLVVLFMTLYAARSKERREDALHDS